MRLLYFVTYYGDTQKTYDKHKDTTLHKLYEAKQEVLHLRMLLTMLTLIVHLVRRCVWQLKYLETLRMNESLIKIAKINHIDEIFRHSLKNV